jgi:hypothetical protein
LENNWLLRLPFSPVIPLRLIGLVVALSISKNSETESCEYEVPYGGFSYAPYTLSCPSPSEKVKEVDKYLFDESARQVRNFRPKERGLSLIQKKARSGRGQNRRKSPKDESKQENEAIGFQLR